MTKYQLETKINAAKYYKIHGKAATVKEYSISSQTELESTINTFFL